MKTKIFIIVLAASILFSCENRHVPYTPDNLELSMCIVKFDNPKFTQYVVAEREGHTYPDTVYTEDGFYMLKRQHHTLGTTMYGIRGVGAVYQELFLGSNPYIELGDGFYLEDWKWGGFIYVDEALLDLKWEELKDRRQVWPMNAKVVLPEFQPEYRIVNRKQIDEFLGIQCTAPISSISQMPIDYLRPLFMWKYNTLQELQDSIMLSPHENITLEEYNAEVARQDSLQIVYVERLKEIIRDGKLNELLGNK